MGLLKCSGMNKSIWRHHKYCCSEAILERPWYSPVYTFCPKSMGSRDAYGDVPCIDSGKMQCPTTDDQRSNILLIVISWDYWLKIIFKYKFWQYYATCYNIQCSDTLSHTIQYKVIHAMHCYALLYFVMPCYAMLWFYVLCCVILFMLW